MDLPPALQADEPKKPTEDDLPQVASKHSASADDAAADEAPAEEDDVLLPEFIESSLKVKFASYSSVQGQIQ